MTALRAGDIRPVASSEDPGVGSSALDTDAYHLRAPDLCAEEAVAFDFDPDPPPAVVEVAF